MTWSIEAATAEDIGAVLALWSVVQAPQSIPDTADAIRRLMSRDPGALIVARSDDDVIGSVIAGWDGWRGTVYRLAVHPSHRRAGVATALIRTGERRLEALGARRIGAIVERRNEGAIAVWAAAGYTEVPGQSRYARNV